VSSKDILSEEEMQQYKSFIKVENKNKKFSPRRGKSSIKLIVDPKKETEMSI